jgi:hypothetical protein|tara:strand:- start:523 stop:924 length:402 start_codon:yes stop_codon:yes gene_type:complete
MKKKSIAKLKKDVWYAFSLFIRRRDCLLTTGSPEYGECISCDKSLRIALLHAGHYVHNKSATYFNERNVNAQCARCNTYLHGNQVEYRHGLIDRYGEGVPEEIETEARQEKVFTRPELEGLLEYYKKLIKGSE